MSHLATKLIVAFDLYAKILFFHIKLLCVFLVAIMFGQRFILRRKS